MIGKAALCPHPPMLLRELCGQADPAADLRLACQDAVGWLLADLPEVVVVVGGADEAATWDPAAIPPVHRFAGSAPSPGSANLPLSAGVGRRLLAEAGWDGPVEVVTLAWDASEDAVEGLAAILEERADRVALLLLGDGSARRGEKAPGHLDDRAHRFDTSVAEALRTGDADVLCRIDHGLAADLLVQGGTAFRLLGSAALTSARPVRAELTYTDDPFGVTYFVARWDLTA